MRFQIIESYQQTQKAILVQSVTSKNWEYHWTYQLHTLCPGGINVHGQNWSWSAILVCSTTAFKLKYVSFNQFYTKISMCTALVYDAGPRHAKMCLMPYANNKGADQPAHPRSLISTFVVRCLDSRICILAISNVKDSS